MTVPGVGVIAALTYRTGVDVPEQFTRSRSPVWPLAGHAQQ